MSDSESQLSEHARNKANEDYEYAPDDLSVDDEDTELPNWEEDDEGNITSYEDGEGDDAALVDFDGNLAELLDRHERIAIGQDLLDYIDQDIRDREPHDRKYAEGIRRSGLAEEAPGGAPFDGASVVTHPILTECTIDFEASAMKEIMPPDGPVKTRIMGQLTPEKREKSERKRDYMNWQLRDQIEEYCDTLENLLMQLPLSGTQYRHWFYDEDLGRPSVELLTSDNVFLPYGTSNFYMSPRLTLREEFTDDEIEDKISSGAWVDIHATSSAMMPERTRTQVAAEKVDGLDEPMMNEDGIQQFYRVFINKKFDFDPENEGERAPYMLIIDATTGDIPLIRRNWEEGDEKRLKLDHVSEWKFFPWKGPYGIGFTHMIGGLSAAMTGALRALLDTAHINNFPSLLKLKSKTGGQSLTLEATGITEIEGSTPVDDIRKLIMPVPFNPPSTVLFQLLGWLDGVAKGVVTTAEEKIADATNNGPVGTTLALIEQGSKVYANIHSRLHRSVKKELKILHRLNKMYLDDQQVVEEIGDKIVYRKDFEGPMDVIPVSDPNIFSESQRYAQLQAVRQIQQMNPEQFNVKALIRRELKQLRIDDIDELLVPDPQITKANPVAENIMMAKGRPAAVFPDQDHMAHMKVLIAFMQDQNLGMSPIIAPKFMPLAVQHLADHLVMWYGSYVYDAMGQVVGPEFQEYMSLDAAQPKIDRVLGLITDEIHGNIAQTLQGMPQVVQQAVQLISQYQQPHDPMSREVDRKSARDKVEGQLKGQKLQLDNQKLQSKTQVDMARNQTSQLEIQAETDNVQTKTAATMIESLRDNETALEIAQMQIDADEHAHVTDGSGFGKS